MRQKEQQMHLSKVLVANRGEIAVRIFRAVREAGARSVAVYAEADADSLHVRYADEAYALDGGYLDIPGILLAAGRSGADAIHPGYGFLAENADFARAVISAGLVWVGPTPTTIELLGDKARARSLAAEVGAPLAAGTNGPVDGPDDIRSFADLHGLPLVIKAVHGGGGRGMRLVRDRSEISEAYDAAVREASVAFGNGDCLVERFLDAPRHLEVQILADTQGRTVALGTRDCSLQRRNQKLVEEAPAPFLPAETVRAMTDAAVAICEAAHYVGAGTVEFLLGSDGTLSFLEVNTRIQVEHAVTEEVSGIDIVAEQLRIAAGSAMNVPEEVPAFGHAIEFRINAEDPALGFLPSPGTIERLRIPTGPGVRFDAGIDTGSAVSGSFDSLLAKLIVRGRDRDEALSRGRRALGELEIDGVATVLPFHRALLSEAAFVGEGEAGYAVHTRWIEEEFSAELSPAEPTRAPEPENVLRLPFEIDGRRVEVGVPSGVLARLGRIGSPASAAPDAAASDPSVAAADEGAVLAQFTGTLSLWKVSDGASVAEGETVAILEAMKMEIPVRAPRAGRLQHRAEKGAMVSSGDVLAQVAL